MKKSLPILVAFFCISCCLAQYKKLSPNAEVSIITGGPGALLYEGFGHSTIRIKDTDFDTAYNYGIFDFNAPNFYLNFTKGRLLYKLERYPFQYFVRGYEREKRWIKEQVLSLNQQEKQAFFEYLENNAKPENATYLYDPFFNNCATILREITSIILKEKVTFYSHHIEKKSSFRTLMNAQIPWNTWGSFGINLALGSKLDHIATEKEHMYLPSFVYEGFKNARISSEGKEKSLVKAAHYILTYDKVPISSSLLSPLFVFIGIFIMGISITYRDIHRKVRSKWFDFTLFFTTGLIGLLITFLWFFTNHSTTPENYNLLWAFAPNFFIAFYLLKERPKKWVRNYVIGVLLLLCLIPFIWWTQVQQFPTAITPLLVLLALRFYYLKNHLLQ